MPGTLYVVATPIGNLSDASARCLETLGAVDAIVCEDTRVTAKLLAANGISRPLVSHHHHSTQDKTRQIIERLANGENLALVTDAGTPAISDPGGELVRDVAAAFEDAKIIPIPGPSAAIAALSVAGFPADRFVFLGFPPHKKGRNAWFKELNDRPETVVFYESPHRIEKTLRALEGEGLKGRPLVVCRELTKLHETIYRGTAAEIMDAIKATSAKGEFVIVVGPM